jgi:hypothetical protein
MKIEDLVEIASDQECLSGEVAQEVLSYGICEFLKVGCSYTHALKLIEKAETGIQKETYQKQLSGVKPESSEED